MKIWADIDFEWKGQLNNFFKKLLTERKRLLD